MKTKLNWRWLVLYALFTAGFSAVILMFGEDERPVGEWVEVRIILAAIAAACLYPLCRLAKKWEREGKIKIEEPK